MKYTAIFIFILFLFPIFPQGVFAYEAATVEQPSPFKISELKDVTTEQWFVGELNNFPHTFEFLLTEATTFKVQVMYSEDSLATEQMSVLMVKEAERGVTEVMRRTADKVEWTAFTDPVSGLHFYENPIFDDRLEAGVYRVEVSNPNNVGRYVLKIGYEDDNGGYFNTLKDIKTLRNGLDLNTFGMIGNKYVYVPLFALVSVIFFSWFWFKRRWKLAL